MTTTQPGQTYTPTKEDAIELQLYAVALQHLLQNITGSNNCSKIYDPLTVDFENRQFLSYAFDMLEGGRRHSFDNYTSTDHVKDVLCDEIKRWLDWHYSDKAKALAAQRKAGE